MNEVPSPIFERFPWLKWLVGGGGAGVAVTLGLAGIRAIEQHPEFLPQLLNGNAMWFALFVVGMVVFDRRLQSYADVHQRSAAAQEQLASNVGALVAKDDAEAEASRAGQRYMAATLDQLVMKTAALDQIVAKLNDFERRLPPHAG